MTLTDIVSALDTLAPFRNAADWDNVGLLIGRSDAACSKALLCIDLTTAVLDEAKAASVQAIVAYHPVLFEPRTNVCGDDPQGRLILDLIEAGIAVVSPHTALDAAPGGMSEWLADGIGPGSTAPIEPTLELPAGEAVKLITYVPRENVEDVRAAIAAAGAGHIGDYDTCSTSIESIGTFRGGDTTNPAICTRGSLEHVDECRLMLVCSTASLPAAVEALRKAHPYEEPPIHVVQLSKRPSAESGSGRVLTLNEPADTATIAARLKDHFGVDQLRMANASDGPHATVGCCPGSGGSLLSAAAAQGATLFVTGEMRHHDVLNATAQGVSVLLAGHTNTERGYLPTLCDRLNKACPSINCTVSHTDTTPWVTV